MQQQQHQQQDYLCSSTNNNLSQPQQQYICLDGHQTAIQPTLINQIPVFNSLSNNAMGQSIVTIPQAPIQRAGSFIIQQPQLQFVQQPQMQSQPLQIMQQPQAQSLQIIQQPQMQAQPLQIIQQPQQFQLIGNPQMQPGQLIQMSSGGPQLLQRMSSLLPLFHSHRSLVPVPAQTVTGSSLYSGNGFLALKH